MQTSLSPCHIPDQQEEADDYSPLLKRARHLFANNTAAAAAGVGGLDGPPSSVLSVSPPPLPCRQQSPMVEQSHASYTPTAGGRHNGGGGDREPWLRPPTAASSSSPRSSGHDSSLVESSGLSLHHNHHHTHQQQQQQQQQQQLQHHKYDGGSKYDSPTSGVIDSKSLLSRALEKSDRGDDDSVSDDNNTTGSENDRPGSASLDGTIKSDRGDGGGGDHSMMPQSVSNLFPPGLEALYRQAGFSPFLNLGANGPSGGMSHHLPGPSTTHIGLQSHAANPTSKPLVLPVGSSSLSFSFIHTFARFLNLSLFPFTFFRCMAGGGGGTSNAL